LEAQLFAAKIPYIMGLRPSHGSWQFVDDPAHPPAFTPVEAAARLPWDAWERTERFDSPGQALVRYIAELELRSTYGPDTGVRLCSPDEHRPRNSEKSSARIEIHSPHQM
jgi:hypothetical protein